MSDVATTTSTIRSHRPKPEKSSIPTPVQSETPLQLDATAILSPKAIVKGIHPIEIGASSIINPYAILDSSAGPLEIGEGCIIWESALIGGFNKTNENVAGSVDQEAQGRTESTILGENCIVEAKALVSAGAILKNACHIEVGATVGLGAILEDVSFVANVIYAVPRSDKN